TDEVNRLKLMVIAMTGVIGLMLTFFATLFMNRTVVYRIAALGKQVAQVGRTGDLSLRVHASGSDEISHLAEDVNTTLESLEQTQADKDRMARQLEQDQAQLRDYFDRAHDLIFALDTHGRLTLVNHSACSVLGYAEEDLLGRSALDIVSPASRDFALTASGAIESGDTVATTTIDVLTRDGNRRTLDVSGQRLFSDGRLTGTFYIARDITDRLRMDHEVLRNQALESLGTLAAGIAHDFNNVLTVVKGNLSLADLSADDPTELRHHVEVARIAAERAQALASQLLTFSRGGAPATENVNVETTVREVARFALSGSNIALRIDVDETLPAVEADPNQLFQVIQNIILNARDAMLSGGTLTIVIHGQTVSEEQPFGFAAPGECVVIEIMDTGPGITPEDMKRLFDPFFTTKPSGHGVGLATARSIARRHEGDLIVESVQGKGTTVRLCMPVAQGPASQTESTETATTPGVTTGRVLVMDDEQTVADVTCAMARRLGYEAAAVADGRAALTAYEQAMVDQHPFDLVIMDLTIPGGMGGREAVQRLLALHPEARVIVASGYSDDASIADYTRCGFIASLPKPYTMQDLQRVLREASKPRPSEA
ncbi:MAG TPA: ATP-binding protein, partial [Clostridia bacterium]|nr:ATP-binding protein [Clostridia bacterium]